MSRILKVLVIDDSDDDAALIFRQLRKEYYEAFSERVETEAALLAALDNHNWDVVLCDYRMPLLDCYKALALVKRHDATLPFILISAFLDDIIIENIIKAGADNCISKSNMSQLIPTLEKELVTAKIKRNQKRQQDGNQPVRPTL